MNLQIQKLILVSMKLIMVKFYQNCQSMIVCFFTDMFGLSLDNSLEYVFFKVLDKRVKFLKNKDDKAQR